MRQIFSVRFFAAVGAVVGLFLLLTTIFATREVIEGDDVGPAPVVLRDVDLVEQVFAPTNPDFELDDDGLAATDTGLVIDGSRTVRVVTGTPGELHCERIDEIGACAVVADLIGEAVVWFALVPMGRARTVELPAIDVLDDGVATLVNGWQVPFAPILDRRCPADEFGSYRELRDELGDDFTSIYSIAERRLIAVQCRTRVDYAPVIESESTAGSTPGSTPESTVSTP